MIGEVREQDVGRLRRTVRRQRWALAALIVGLGFEVAMHGVDVTVMSRDIQRVAAACIRGTR